jgi:hypothetical protein
MNKSSCISKGCITTKNRSIGEKPLGRECELGSARDRWGEFQREIQLGKNSASYFFA